MIKIIPKASIKDEAAGCSTITFVSGMAGICSVGRIAVDVMVTQFQARLVALMYLDDLPAQVVIDEKGMMNLPVVHIFLAKPAPDACFLLVTGEYQPSSNAGMFAFVDKLMRYLIEEQGVNITTIISIGAYIVEQVPSAPKVFVSGTDARVITSFLETDKATTRLMENGLISGANGVIPAWGTVLGIPGICLLAETVPVVKQDPRAAKLVIELLSKHFGFPFDFTPLVKGAREVETLLAEFNKTSRGASEMEQQARRDRQSYIG